MSERDTTPHPLSREALERVEAAIFRPKGAPTSTPMSDFDRAAARERAEKATPGPWVNDKFWWKIGSTRGLADGYWQGIDGVGDVHGYVAVIQGDDPEAAVDAEFIAHARTDLPAALDALDDRDRTIAQLRETLDDALSLCDAVRRLSTSAVALSDHLQDHPYADAPDQTPWSRFLGPRVSDAYDIAAALRAKVSALGPTP